MLKESGLMQSSPKEKDKNKQKGTSLLRQNVVEAIE
jgi:hypothetical protein